MQSNACLRVSSGILLHHFIVPSSSSSSFSASFCPFWAKLPFPLFRFSLFVAQLQFFRCFRIVDDVCMIMGQHQQRLQAQLEAQQLRAWTKLYPVLIDYEITCAWIVCSSRAYMSYKNFYIFCINFNALMSSAILFLFEVGFWMFCGSQRVMNV